MQALCAHKTVMLCGNWEFGYQPVMAGGEVPILPPPSLFETTMPVPARWDDHLDRLRCTSLWPVTRFNPEYREISYPTGPNPPDASLPFLLGLGWYRRRFALSPEEAQGCVTLRIGGATVDLWCWLNGTFIGHHRGHAAAFDLPLAAAAREGENELILAASNLRMADSFGCDQRGQHAYSGGIYRPVSLLLAGPVRIRSLYVRVDDTAPERVTWRVELEGPDGRAPAASGMEIDWEIRGQDDGGKALGSGTVSAEAGSLVEWTTSRCGMQPWSDRDPVLYEIQAKVRVVGRDSDERVQPFGLRRLRRDGTSLRLNGIPVYLRGHCEHHYFPLTCTAPTDVETYRSNIRALKQLGFNWLRFHTWIPGEEYMQAADELGMLIQVEPAPPVAARTETEWLDIFRTCRHHPSVVIYCGGNEEALDPPLIELLAGRAALMRQHVPDALFSPMEALRGVEYFWAYAPIEEMIRTMPDPEGMVLEPYPHHTGRLRRLKEFSDCFGQYSWAQLSYGSVHANPAMLDAWLADYERPCMTHELGILANFLNLDLEHRYVGTRIGPGLYAALRAHLAEKGLLCKARRYYRGSCQMMRVIRKHTVESARKVRLLSGYDMLGATDQHWHRTGYPCGVLNEFFELKPGESEADVLRYNGESVLLECGDNPRLWNFVAGTEFRTEIRVSLFGPDPLPQGTLSWTLRDAGGQVLERGARACGDIPNGRISAVGTVAVRLPQVMNPLAATLTVRLEGGRYQLENAWRLWVFPAVPSADPDATRGGLGITTSLDSAAIDFLAAGGDILLLGNGPFPAQEINFQGATTGRPTGHRGLLVNDHPALAGFPHDGGMDWQFFSMIEQAQSVLFEDGQLPFDPIVEVIPCYKNIKRQSVLFEFRVGKGRLLVCSLRLDRQDPACAWLLDSLRRYMTGSRFAPLRQVEPGVLRAYTGSGTQVQELQATDQALDPTVARRRTGKQ